jgi:hypothetical protein
VLQSKGLRQHTGYVLLLNGQQKVFIQGMRHKGCHGQPDRKGALTAVWCVTIDAGAVVASEAGLCARN